MHPAIPTSLPDISRLLHETVGRERSIELKLNQQLASRGGLEREVLLIDHVTSEVCNHPGASIWGCMLTPRWKGLAMRVQQ